MTQQHSMFSPKLVRSLIKQGQRGSHARVGNAMVCALMTLGVTLPAIAAVTQPSMAQVKAPVMPTISVNQSQDGMVALVNDSPILKSELTTAVAAAQARLQAAGQTVNAQRLQSDVLNQLIVRRLQLDLVKRAGIRPNPEAVNQRLAEVAKAQGLSSLSALQQAMDSRQPGSYAGFRNRLIEDEAIVTLQRSQLRDKVRITEQDIDAFLASPEAQQLQPTEYRTIHIRVPFIDDYSRISEAQKQEAMLMAQKVYDRLQLTDDAQQIMNSLTNDSYPTPLQGGDMGYHEAKGLPIAIAAIIPTLQVGEVSAPKVVPEGIDVVKLVDKRDNSSTVIPQWRVRHILIKTDENTSEELAKQQINDIYEQLRRGASFAALASTYSDDPGSAGRGGDLDWVSEDQMVPEFEDMMKKTSTGDYSSPFKSQFGWHILQVDETRMQDITDTVKRGLAGDTLYQRLAPQAQEDWLQELRSNAYIEIFE